MGLDAIKPNTNHQLRVVAIERKRTEGTDKPTEEKLIREKQPEVLIFKNKNEFAKVAPKITEVSNPVKEQSKVAVASVNKPLFDFQKTTPSAQFAGPSIFAGLATAGALKSPEQNSSSGDKKEGQNTFLSANKDLLDIRKEPSKKAKLETFST